MILIEDMTEQTARKIRGRSAASTVRARSPMSAKPAARTSGSSSRTDSGALEAFIQTGHIEAMRGD
jgi:hypothetical protein